MDAEAKALVARQIDAMVAMATGADHLRLGVDHLQGSVAQLTALVLTLQGSITQLTSLVLLLNAQVGNDAV
jgi:ABC-type microcin C transport system permease subunit YejE